MAFNELTLNEQPGEVGVTSDLARYVADLSLSDVPERARRIARLALLDLYAVSLAGSREEPLRILAAQILEDGGAPRSTLIGLPGKASPAQAALFAGTASHVLDYNDIHMLVPHPSISVVPALLALGEATGASGEAVLVAYIAGYEAICGMAQLLAPHLYDRGWQASAVGAIGSAVACAKLLDLDAHGIEQAMAIGAAQSCGIQGNSGSMLKPLNAGFAARAGVTAASLAARGFVGNRAILERKKGFIELYANLTLPDARLAGAPEGWHLYRSLFKRHACCFMNHAPLEAWDELRRRHHLHADEVESVRVTVEGTMHRIVFTPPPTTGLQAKLNLRFCMAMAMHGVETSSPASFDQAVVERSELHASAERVSIDIDDTLPPTQAGVLVACRDGRQLQASADVGVPCEDLDLLTRRVHDKARLLLTGLLADQTEPLIERFGNLHRLAKIADIHPQIGAT